MKRIIFLFTMGVVLVTAYISSAQNGFIEGGFIEKFDQDGDGKVSLKEFQKGFSGFEDASKVFKRFDKNGDGFITSDEAPNGQRQKPEKLNQEEIKRILREVWSRPTQPNQKNISTRLGILERLLISLGHEGYDLKQAEALEKVKDSMRKNDLIKAAALIDKAFSNLEQLVLQKQSSQDVTTKTKQNDNVTKPKQIEVFLDNEKGVVRNILGVTDPPVSPILHKKRVPPGSKYQEIGIKYCKIGNETDMAIPNIGDGVKAYVGLGAIFLDNSKNANDTSNYDFRKVDEAIASCLENNITPVFQLLYDINCFEDNCGKGYPKRRVKAEGYKPDDYDKWVAVAINVIKHFNGLFNVSKQARSFSPGDVKYFFIWDEPSDPDWEFFRQHTGIRNAPLWTGTFSDFWNLYEKLINKIETDPGMLSIKNIIKLGGPSMDYRSDSKKTFEPFEFAKKVMETKTRMDFINQDFYQGDFWAFLHGWEGMKKWEEIYNELKNHPSGKYKNLEWHLNAFNFPWDAPQGYRKPGQVYYPGANYESYYGAALLASYLIYAEGTNLTSFMWHGGQGDYATTPFVPLGFGKLFNGWAKLQYAGLAYKMFSEMLSFDGPPAIKVASKGEEFNYSGEVKEQRKNKLVGYRNQDLIRILSAKSKDRKEIKILVANWNIDPKKSRYGSYNIKIKGALEGNYKYKIFAIDESHTFPKRWTAGSTWELGNRNRFPREIQQKITELEGRVEELISVYYPDRKNDKSIRYEGELGLAKEGTISCENNEINLQVSNVTGSVVHLIELDKK